MVASVGGESAGGCTRTAGSCVPEGVGRRSGVAGAENGGNTMNQRRNLRQAGLLSVTGGAVCVWAAVLGGAGAALAQNGGQDETLSAQTNTAVFRGNVYVNVATGEMSIWPAATGQGAKGAEADRSALVAEGGSPSIWDNTDYLGAGALFPWQTWFKEETVEWVTWGTIEPGMYVDCVEVAYATHMEDPEAQGVEGLDLLLSFWEEYAGFGEPATLLRTFRVDDLPGSDGELNMWVVTIDLADSGQEFLIDPENLDEQGNAQLGFGYAWDTTEVEAIDAVGPVLTLPANKGGEGTSTGSEGTFDWYWEPGDASQASYFGSFVFEVPFLPFPSFYLDLHGMDGDLVCEADCDGDGTATVLDFVCFQGQVSDQLPAADCNGDGAWDVVDYICFQQLYAAGCP